MSGWGIGSSSFFFHSSQYQPLLQSQVILSYTPTQLEELEKLKIRSLLPILCWIEKFIVLVDFFQIFSIIWNAAQPYPWPYLWIHFSRPLLYVNLDFFSLTDSGALNGQSANLRINKWGQMDGYLNYALGYAGGSAFLVIAYALLLQRHDHYGQLAFHYRHHLLAIILLLAYLFYLPASMAVMRIYYCQDDGHVLSVDPSVQCYGAVHGIYLILCTILFAPLFLGLPIVLYYYARENIVYQNAVDHEKRLTIVEVLQMLELDNVWLRDRVFVLSSFRLFGCYLWSHMTMLKASLMLIFIFLRYDLPSQATALLVVISVFGAYYTFYKYPFRCLSTNFIFGAALSSHIVNLSFGLANSAGVESAVMAASTEYITLLSYNCACYFIMALVLVYTLWQKITDWPSLRTLHRIYHDAELLPKASRWVEIIRESHNVQMDFLLAPVEVADVNALEHCIRLLRRCWMEAKACGSLFETPLCDTLEELVLVHSSRYRFALRKLPYWDQAYQHAASKNTFADRRERHFLMNPRKRRLLIKLLAYKFLRGSYQSSFSFAHVDEYKRLTAFEMEMRQQRRKSIETSGQPLRFSFSAFSHNAAHMLRQTSSLFSVKEVDHSKDSEDEKEVQLSQKEKKQTPRPQENEDDEEMGPGGPKRFDPDLVREAKKMISQLQTRTEAALNKHHQAKKTLFEQLQQSKSSPHLRQLLNANASTSSLSSMGTGSPHGLAKISTMELMKQTVDIDEQKDLEDLFHLWDDAIQLYEKEEFPGDYEELNIDVENWYAYRGLVSQRLELIVQFLEEQEQLMNEIGAQEVIEEGDDEDHLDLDSHVDRLVSDDESHRSSHQGGRLVSDNDLSRHIGGGRLVSDSDLSRHIGGGRLVSDNDLSRHIGGGRLVSDNDLSRHIGGRLISDDEPSPEGRHHIMSDDEISGNRGRLVSDDDDDDEALRDDIVSSKSAVGRLSSSKRRLSSRHGDPSQWFGPPS